MESFRKIITKIWCILIHRCLHIYIYKAHYLRLNINPERLADSMKGFDLDVKELVYDDFLKGDPNVFQGKKMELYKQRCQDPTYKAYGIIENGQLVYSAWVSLHRIGMSIETHPYYLLANEGYLEDAYCNPIARGRGFHGKMNNYRIKKILEAGRNWAIVILLEGNTPAFKVQFKSGFEDLGVFHFGYFLGIKFNTFNKKKFDDK